MKSGISVVEDLLALVGRSCNSGQGQELPGAVLPKLNTQRRPSTKSYNLFFLVMRPTDTIVLSVHTLSTEILVPPPKKSQMKPHLEFQRKFSGQ